MSIESDIWEGQFIDVSGHNLNRTFTLGNIYRPPHDNNNNENVGRFIDEISPVVDFLQKENAYTALV